MKVWNYMMIMLTLMVFLSFMGFATDSSDTILNMVGISINSSTGTLVSGDVGNSNWFDNLFNPVNGLIVLAGIGTAVIVGLFTRQFEWKLVLLAFFTSFVVKFVAVGLSVVSLAEGETWLVGVIATIFLPLTAMFIFSIVEWFGGTE